MAAGVCLGTIHATTQDIEESAMNELCGKGAGELAGMIATGEVTSSEVLEAHLARIAEDVA